MSPVLSPFIGNRIQQIAGTRTATVQLLAKLTALSRRGMFSFELVEKEKKTNMCYIYVYGIISFHNIDSQRNTVADGDDYIKPHAIESGEE